MSAVADAAEAPVDTQTGGGSSGTEVTKGGVTGEATGGGSVEGEVRAVGDEQVVEETAASTSGTEFCDGTDKGPEAKDSGSSREEEEEEWLIPWGRSPRRTVLTRTKAESTPKCVARELVQAGRGGCLSDKSEGIDVDG